MSSLRTISACILLSLSIAMPASMAQGSDDDVPAATQALQNQVKQDSDELKSEQDQLTNYQQQAKFYDQFAKKRLDNSAALRKDVEGRLKALQASQSKTKGAQNKHLSQEMAHLQAWLDSEASQRRQIEQTRDRWKTAIEELTTKIQNSKYQKDVDQASLAHQQGIDKTNAAIQAENPKPAPAPVQGPPMVLSPGFEETQGTIPYLLGPGHN